MELSPILACISFSRVSCCSASWASFQSVQRRRSSRSSDPVTVRRKHRDIGGSGDGLRQWAVAHLKQKKNAAIAGHSWARISMNFFPSVKSVQKLLTFPAVQGIATSKGLNWSCQTLGVKSHPDSQSQGKPGKARESLKSQKMGRLTSSFHKPQVFAHEIPMCYQVFEGSILQTVTNIYQL